MSLLQILPSKSVLLWLTLKLKSFSISFSMKHSQKKNTRRSWSYSAGAEELSLLFPGNPLGVFCSASQCALLDVYRIVRNYRLNVLTRTFNSPCLKFFVLCQSQFFAWIWVVFFKRKRAQSMFSWISTTILSYVENSSDVLGKYSEFRVYIKLSTI